MRRMRTIGLSASLLLLAACTPLIQSDLNAALYYNDLQTQLEVPVCHFSGDTGPGTPHTQQDLTVTPAWDHSAWIAPTTQVRSDQAWYGSSSCGKTTNADGSTGGFALLSNSSIDGSSTLAMQRVYRTAKIFYNYGLSGAVNAWPSAASKTQIEFDFRKPLQAVPNNGSPQFGIVYLQLVEVEHNLPINLSITTFDTRPKSAYLPPSPPIMADCTLQGVCTPSINVLGYLDGANSRFCVRMSGGSNTLWSSVTGSSAWTHFKLQVNYATIVGIAQLYNSFNASYPIQYPHTLSVDPADYRITGVSWATEVERSSSTNVDVIGWEVNNLLVSYGTDL